MASIERFLKPQRLRESSMKILSLYLVLLFLITAIGMPAAVAAIEEEFKPVKLDRFIEKEKK